MRSEVEGYDPGVVVIQYSGNDFSDNVRELLFDLDSAGELVELPIRSSVKMTVKSILDHVPGLGHTYLFGLARQLKFTNNAPYRVADSELALANLGQSAFEDRLLFALMDQMLTICKDQGWPVLAILVDIPEKRLKKMRDLLSASDARTVVILGKRERPDLYYQLDSHWNASGHRYAAENVCEALENTGGLFE